MPLDDPNGGGAPTPTPQPTPAPAPAPTPTPEPSPTPTPAPSPAPAPTPQTEPDRSNWVPPHRLRETRAQAAAWARQQVQQETARYQAELEQKEARIRALAGVEPQEHPDVAQVKQDFAKVFPHLAKLNDERTVQRLTDAQANDRLEQLQREVAQLRARDSHYWDSHTRQAINTLFTAVEKGIGNELSNDAKRAIHGSFVGYVRTNPQVAARYTQDPTSVVNEYWKTLQTTLVDPVRRAQAAAVQSGAAPAPVPQDKPSGAPRTTPPPVPKSLDDAVKGSWQAYKTETGQ